LFFTQDGTSAYTDETLEPTSSNTAIVEIAVMRVFITEKFG
jgi:hypothetical protein